MATWNKDNVVITQKGLEILSKVQAGIGSIEVTKIVTGGGYVSPSLLYKQTQVTEEKQQVTINKVITDENGSEISVYFTNSGNESEYNLYQIGIYVRHEDYSDEVLYLIAQCDTSNPDHIPLPSVTVATFQYSIYMEHSSTQNVEVSVNQNGFITVNLIGSPGGVASLDSSGKIPVSQIPQLQYAGIIHTHTISQVEGLNTALSNKADLVDGEVPLSQLPQLHQDIGVYVDAVNGSDDNNGSLQTPFATIQAAVDSLPKNLGAYSVTIYLAPGEYQAGATIQGFYGGGKRYYQSITIQAKENEFPVINGYVFVVGSSCSVRLSNLKINGRIEGYASADVSFIGGFVDPSTADIGVGIRALEVGNLYLQAVSIDNATEAAVSVARGTAYIRDLRGSGNACAVSAGDTSFGGPALVLTTQISTEATTKYIKLYGGTIIENGVIV